MTRRAAEPISDVVIRGYAALFNVETVIGEWPWGFREIIEPGAFTAAIREDDVRALFNHDANHVLGRRTTGSLRLREDDSGLHYEIDPPNTGLGSDIVALIERGDISGSSFSFFVVREEWIDPPTNDQLPLRRLLELRLDDVAPVTFPAYVTTSVSVAARGALRQSGAVATALELEALDLRLAAARARVL